MIYAKEMTDAKTDEFEAMLMAAQEERTSDACLKGEATDESTEGSSGTNDTSIHAHPEIYMRVATRGCSVANSCLA